MWNPEILLKAGLEPRHLRRLAGFDVSRQTYWLWMRGRVTPPLQRLETLSRVCAAVEACLEAGELPLADPQNLLPEERLLRMLNPIRRRLGQEAMH